MGTLPQDTPKAGTDLAEVEPPSQVAPAAQTVAMLRTTDSSSPTTTKPVSTFTSLLSYHLSLTPFQTLAVMVDMLPVAMLSVAMHEEIL